MLAFSLSSIWTCFLILPKFFIFKSQFFEKTILGQFEWYRHIQRVKITQKNVFISFVSVVEPIYEQFISILGVLEKK